MTEEAVVTGFFRKREMLDGNRTAKDTLSREGRDLVSQGLLDEALLFLVKAQDLEGMELVLQESCRKGDAFSFEASLRALGRPASRKEWDEVGEQAFANGKHWFAYRAFEKAENQEGLEKVRQAMAEEGIPLR